MPVRSDLTSKKHTLAGFNGVSLGGGFVVKRMLHSHHGFIYLLSLWCGSILWFGYWFRCAENTACQFPDIGLKPIEGCESREARIWVLFGADFEKQNNTLLQDAVWLMFVTATSIGYGEVSTTTHTGRAIACTMGLWGLLVAAILTASLSQNLQWSKVENTTNRLVEREVKRTHALLLAVTIIQRWWRVVRKGYRSPWMRLALWWQKGNLGDLRRELIVYKKELAVPVDDSSGACVSG